MQTAPKKGWTIDYNARKWLVIALLSLVWGSSFILIKKSLIAFGPLQVSSLRILIAAICMLPFFIRHLRNVRREHWPALLVVGIIGTGIPAFCYPIAETQISSIATGILNSLTPLFTILLGALLFKVPATWSRLAGVVLGLLGAILIISRREEGADQNLLYGLFVVFGALCYAFSGNTVKAGLQSLNSVTIGVVSFTILGPPALIFLLSTNIVEVFASDPNL